MKAEEKERWERLLREKMQGYREEAPADGWARIHATLSGMAGRPEMAAMRPLHRSRWIGYAAAAAVVAALLTLGIFLPTGREHTTVAEVQPDVEVQPPMAETAIEPMESSPLLHESSVAQHGVAGGALPQQGHRNLKSDGMANATEPSEEAPATLPEDAEQSSDHHAGEPQAHSDASGSSEKDSSKQPEKVSPAGVPAEWYRTLLQAEQAKEHRKLGRVVSASLYVANMPGSSSATLIERSPSAAYLYDSADVTGNSIITSSAQSRMGNSETTWKHRTPVTFGATVGFPVAPRMALETGVIYTRLFSESETQDYPSTHIIQQKLDYLGIPVSFTYRFIDSRLITFYGRAGGTLEYCISAREFSRVESGNGTAKPFKVTGLQNSLGIGAGAMLNIAPLVGIYVEPGASYYFENLNQPASYRTEHPLNFNLRVGVRMNLK